MYCSHCRRTLFYKNLEHLGWCESCGKIVSVSSCKVSYWILAVTLAMLWIVQA
jgi:hypothetical protein